MGYCQDFLIFILNMQHKISWTRNIFLLVHNLLIVFNKKLRETSYSFTFYNKLIDVSKKTGINVNVRLHVRRKDPPVQRSTD